MYKLRATRREMSAAYHYIISIGYCEAQGLLHYDDPIAYSAGIYSWDCDYYIVDNVLICTGYRPIAAKHTRYDYRELAAQNERAWEIITDHSIPYEDARARVRDMLRS